MSEIKVLNGNMAAAEAVFLAKPDVIAAYPITPQTPLVEYLSQMKADGKVDAEMTEVESELSAMSVLTGASLAGARTFTATASQGLALMYEPYFRASTLRLPIVMNIVDREMISPQSLWGGPQDSLTIRDAGWVQMHAQDNQEILDMTYMAFRIAEDPKVLLPINVCYDGFYLSHMSEPVEVPSEEEVRNFLPDYSPNHVLLDPSKPMAVDPLTNGELVMEYRYRHLQAQQSVFEVLNKVEKEYAKRTGREYTGPLETYRVDDADFVLIVMGSMSGAGKEAVDLMRGKGYKVGLIRIRLVRPFPAYHLSEALKDKKAFGVVDRNVSFGWNTGIIFQEVNSALEKYGVNILGYPFIAGLGGVDIRIEHFEMAIERICSQNESGKKPLETVWLTKLEG